MLHHLFSSNPFTHVDMKLNPKTTTSIPKSPKHSTMDNNSTTTTTKFASFHLEKIKRSLLTFLFCFRTYFFALLLLFLLYSNGAFIFCLKVPSFTPQTPPNSLSSEITIQSPSLIYALREEPPVPKSTTHSAILHKFNSLNSSSVLKNPKFSRKKRPVYKIVQPTDLSRQFSARAKEFFNGYGSNSSCKFRFFITWISSLDSFSYRELFSIESVFKSHPNACLLIISTSLDSKRGAQLLSPFKDQGFRVSAISPDFDYIFKNTPAEAWFNKLNKGQVNPGEVSIGQNLSNLLRLAVLYKYGGIYMDTDFIILKRLTDLRNVIGAQMLDLETGNWSRLNNAVMIFDKKHPLLFKFIQEFALTFDGNKWGHNGPYLVSRVVSRVSGGPGFNFTVLPPMAFYPVDWSRIQGLFHGPRDGEHLKWISAKLNRIRNESFGLHLWNKKSRKLKADEGSIISQLMLDSCVFCNGSVSAL